MAFYLYEKTNDGENLEGFRRVGKIKFSGEEGIIAKHVTQLPDEEAEQWSLSEKGALDYVTEGKDAAGYALVFDADPKSETSVALYRLVRVAGQSQADETEMVFVFEVLVDGSEGKDPNSVKEFFQVEQTGKRKELCEPLRLTGGTNPKLSTWKWGRPSMSIGGAVVG